MPPTEEPEPAAAACPAPDLATLEAESLPAGSAAGRRVDRRGIAVGAVLLAACAGLVLYGVLDTEEKSVEPKRPTASVTYEVTGEGTADLTYQARSESGTAVVARRVSLPWKKTVRVPLGRAPIVTITLDANGGQARCALAVRGRHVQTATAYGSYGRATCQGELPAPENTTDAVAPAQGES
ncbi:hypothetical protein OG778_29850 [Streptomyces sp. NBC_00184]|uniref:hypothetical protein n=1 Tax=Streptomyces sp. NBC_00184 TaxID=2975673 RepID=UPI002E281EAD|nr:hypothetical protein [Streptomyces sp. NBC_00184]